MHVGRADLGQRFLSPLLRRQPLVLADDALQLLSLLFRGRPDAVAFGIGGEVDEPRALDLLRVVSVVELVRLVILLGVRQLNEVLVSLIPVVMIFRLPVLTHPAAGLLEV